MDHPTVGNAHEQAASKDIKDENNNNNVNEYKVEKKIWDTKFEDPQRQAYHDRKMQSKDSRPAKQLAVMGMQSGTVVHELLMS